MQTDKKSNKQEFKNSNYRYFNLRVRRKISSKKKGAPCGEIIAVGPTIVDRWEPAARSGPTYHGPRCRSDPVFSY